MKKYKIVCDNHMVCDDTVERAVVGDLPEYQWAGDARVRDIIAGLAAGGGGCRRRLRLHSLPSGGAGPVAQL